MLFFGDTDRLFRLDQVVAPKHEKIRIVVRRDLADHRELDVEPVGIAAQRDHVADFPAMLAHQQASRDRGGPVVREPLEHLRRKIVVGIHERDLVRVERERLHDFRRVLIAGAKHDHRHAGDHAGNFFHRSAIARRHAKVAPVGVVRIHAQSLRGLFENHVDRAGYRCEHREDEGRDREREHRENRAPRLSDHVAENEMERLHRITPRAGTR